MRTRNLTLAILFGLGMTHIPILISTAQAEEAQASIEQIEARINKIDEIMTRASNRFLASAPSIDKVNITTADYQNTNDGATANTTLTIDFAPQYLGKDDPQTFTLNFADTIIKNADLQNKGIIARIERKIVVDDNLKKLLDLDAQEIKQFSQAIQHLQISMDLLPEGKIAQTFTITPFEVSEDGTSVKFDGLTVTTDENEANMIDGVGKMHLEFKQLTTDSPEQKLTVTPFSVDYELDDDGDLELNTSPIKLTIDKDNTVFTIKRISGKGDDIRFDDAIGGYIGEQEYLLDSIKLNNDKMPTPLILDSVRLTSAAKQSNSLYQYNGGLVIDFNGESISKLSGMTGLELEDGKLNFSSKNISAQTMQTLNQLYAAIGALQPPESEHNTKINDEISARSQALLNQLAADQSSVAFDLAIDTDQGDATFVTNIKVKKDAVTDLNAWQAAFAAPEPTQILDLMQRSLDFNIKLDIPESLVNAAGLTPMMAMGTGFIIKDGSDYTMRIKNTDKGIELNGNLMPLPGEAQQ